MNVQWAFHNRVKQQNRKEQKINECLDLRPHCAVEGCKAAYQVATQDQGEVGEQELGVIHGAENTSRIPWRKAKLGLCV